jgi:calcineurin-like phosphoesterase family protein
MSVLTYRDQEFLLIHNPDEVPKWWKGGVIHGHHHYMLPKYPFIDGKKRNINVSCELIDYSPIELDWVIDLDIDSIKRMNTVKSKPIKW